ncbi:MAG TPA: VWA domain-containing protein [Terriglobia bacterium]|nr:VWA domain-containing protein [Terriglobia bacterium]
MRIAVVSLLLAALTFASAQNVPDRDYSLAVDVELVQLSVSVLDKHGFPIRGLQREHFAVYEDKVQQDISLFSQEDIPLSVALVIDTSSSMFNKLASVNSAGLTFVRESNPQDETSIVTFGTTATLEQDFTTNTRELGRALSGIVPNGYTALYDAVYLAAKHLRQESAHEKKVLLIISDGEDNDSKYKLKEVLEAIRESKIIVYSIGLLSSDNGGDSYDMFADNGKKALRQLAEVTGGSAFFPKGVREVELVCKRIARDLRNQYTIGYKPSNGQLDGSWRKVLVRVNPPKTIPAAKVRTKQGYYAPVAKAAASRSLF